MRIALLTMSAPWSGNTLSGPYNNTQARALNAATVDGRPVVCEIFSPTLGGPRLLEPLLPKLRAFNARPAIDTYLGVRTHTFKGLFPKPPTVRWKLTPIHPALAAWTIARPVERALLRSLKQFAPDALLTHDGLMLGGMTARLARALSRPFAIIEHDPIDFPADSTIGRYYRRTLAPARAIFSVGVPWYLYLRDTLKLPQARLIVNGTTVASPEQIAAPRPDRWQNKRLILTVGSYIERKGHAVLLDAFAKANIAGAHLIIVGPPPDHIRAQVDRLNLADRVEFLPSLPHTDVLQHMAWADLFCLPSWWESFGLVYAEALSACTPVIMTTDSGMSYHITPGTHGWVIPPKDVPALTAALTDALSRPNLRDMGRAGRDLVLRKLTWQRNAEIVLAALRGEPDPDAHRPPLDRPITQQTFSR